jgi:NAD(P)H-hydrate epimerase
VQHGASLERESGDPALAEAVASGRLGELAPRLRELCRYAVRLTVAPGWMDERDLEPLRAAGLDDRAIVDANQVVAYFNYVNRVADGLGVELEPGWPAARREARGYRTVVRADEVPWLTVEQMRELDRIATEELGLSLERMMENAGRNLAALARTLLDGSCSGRAVTVLAGPGGNGGGGMVAARHLAAAGAEVTVVLSGSPDRLAPVPRAQYEILLRTGVRVSGPDAAPPYGELVLDALLGYSQSGRPRGAAAGLIARAEGARVLSLDVPSGLELVTGVLHEPHVRAEATLTLAAPKTGLRSAAAGHLFLADLSIPPSAYERLGVAATTPFAATPIVRLLPGDAPERREG